MIADPTWPPAADVSVRLTPKIWRLLAPNASWMTYEGTNTYLVADDPSGAFTVIDPGSADPAHLDAIVAVAEAEGGRIERVLLTHTHPDHSEGARELAARAGVPIVGMEPAWAETLIVDGEAIPVGDDFLEVVHTPGHSDDSVSLLFGSQRVVLTGDTVLANHPAALFGSLREFLGSVQRLRETVEDGVADAFLPAHGPVANDPIPVVDLVVAGRRKKVAEIAALVDRGLDDVDAIVDELYPHIEGAQARMFPTVTVRNYLDYIHEERALSAPVA